MCETRTAIAVCNGTAALHLALLTQEMQPGDEVIVPSLTFVASANAVRYVGGEPVFVDVDPETWCIDPRKIEGAITSRTKGIIAVHLYGHPSDMDEINRIAGVHGLWVVEDAAEAPFASYKGRPTGGLTPIATFSFYGNKIITCGEGGALTLSDQNLELRARTLRGQGMDPRKRYYFSETGYNFRLTNVACALLCAQLERVNEILERRRHIYGLYRRLLEGLPGIGFQPVAPWADLAPWLFCITIEEHEFGLPRDEVSQKLAREGIETRPFFIPLHTLPPFREGSRKRGEHLPVTMDLSKRGLNLPTYSTMEDEHVERVALTIRALHGK